jgi:phenylacetate-CoA ligase
MKELIVTDLNNYQMPFIRYEVGDMIDDIYPASENNQYPFSYFKHLYGRTTDHVVLPDGKKLFPINVFGGTSFRKFKSIKRHKTSWDGRKLLFTFETDNQINIESLENEIRKSLKDYNVEFKIQIKDKLQPSENGKYRYFEVI